MDEYDLQLTDSVEPGALGSVGQDSTAFLPDDPLTAPRAPPPPSLTGPGNGKPEPGTGGSLSGPSPDPSTSDNGSGGGISGLFQGISEIFGSASKTLDEEEEEEASELLTDASGAVDDASDELNQASGDWEELLERGLDFLNDEDDTLEPDTWEPFSAEGGPGVNGYAIEMRAEHLREQRNRDSSRKGELEVLKVGMNEQNSDAVTGVDRVRISGHLREHTGGGFAESADDVDLEVDGKLDIYSHFEDGIMMAGTLTDMWEDGALVLAAMSDDLAAGIGLRITAPLDLWVQGLSGMEERPGTAFADLVLVELAGTHFEREYGSGIQIGGFASFSGTTFQTQATGFRPLMKTAVRVRNLLPGGGGGAAEPGVSPPPAGISAGAGPGLATQMPMLAAGVGASTARATAGALRVEDTIAMAKLTDMAVDLEDLSSLRRTGETAANLEDLSDARRAGEAVGEAAVEPGTDIAKVLDQPDELLEGMDVHHLEGPEELGDAESGVHVLDGTVEEDPYAYAGVYTTDDAPVSGFDGPIQPDTTKSVLPRPDNFEFNAAYQELARRFVESGNVGDWRAAETYISPLQTLRAQAVETFQQFGGKIDDLNPNFIEQVSDAYRQLGAMADEAAASGDTARAQAIRQAIDGLDEVAHGAVGNIMSGADEVGGTPVSVVGDGGRHMDADDSTFDVGKLESDADDGSGLDAGKTPGELDEGSASSVRLKEPPISDDARLRDTLDPGVSSPGVADPETGGSKASDITEPGGSETLTQVVSDDTLTWHRGDGDENMVVGWESGGNIPGSPEHSGALAIESFADARAVDDAVPDPGLASTGDIVRGSDAAEDSAGAGEDIGGRLGRASDIDDAPRPPEEVELREEMDFDFDPDGDAPEWVKDNYEVEQKLANGHLPEDFNASKVMRRWRKRARKVRGASEGLGNQRFAVLVDEFTQMLRSRECPRKGLNDAMARYTASLGAEEAANTVKVLQTMLGEYDQALNVKYGYRANPGWIADVDTALDLRQVDADVDEILRAEDAIWQRYQDLDPNAFVRPGSVEDTVELSPGAITTADSTRPVVDPGPAPDPDSEKMLFAGGSDSSLIGSFDRAGPPPVPPRPDLPAGLVDDVGGEVGSLEDLHRGGGTSPEPGVGGAAALPDDLLKDTPYHKGTTDTSTLDGYDEIGIRDRGIGDDEKQALMPKDRRDFGYVYDGDDLVSVEYGVPDEMVLNRRNVDAKRKAQILPSGQVGRYAEIMADEAGTEAAQHYTQSHRGRFNVDTLTRVAEEAAGKARLEAINKMWNELPQVNLRSLDDLGDTAPGVRAKVPKRRVGFGDVQSVTFRVQEGTELSKHGKPLKSAVDASSVLDLDTTLRYSLDPTTKAKIVTTPEGWQATRTPGFGRMANASGDFPFSQREQMLTQIMKGQKLSSEQLDLLSNKFYSRFPVNGPARKTAQYKAMDEMLGTLIVTRRSNTNALPANVDWNALYDLARLLDASAAVA